MEVRRSTHWHSAGIYEGADCKPDGPSPGTVFASHVGKVQGADRPVRTLPSEAGHPILHRSPDSYDLKRYMSKFWLVTAAAAILTTSVGCKKEIIGPPTKGTGDIICAETKTTLASCNLPMKNRSLVKVTLSKKTTCNARGNTLRITSPITKVLTSDGCYTPVGTTWEEGPFDAGVPVTMEFSAPATGSPPSLRVSGKYPTWVIEIEDGGDADFDDLVFAVEAQSAR